MLITRRGQHLTSLAAGHPSCRQFRRKYRCAWSSVRGLGLRSCLAPIRSPPLSFDLTDRSPILENHGYRSGNLVKLLRLLRADLKGVDLSRLAIRQVYLQAVEAQGASLVGAHLAETVLGEAFSDPTALRSAPTAPT
jgi:hypothetical protein